MGELSSSERDIVERAAAEPMLDQVLTWAAVNSGSRNLGGLERMADLLADAFAALPGVLRLENPARVEAVSTETVLPAHLLEGVRHDLHEPGCPLVGDGQRVAVALCPHGRADKIGRDAEPLRGLGNVVVDGRGSAPVEEIFGVHRHRPFIGRYREC